MSTLQFERARTEDDMPDDTNRPYHHGDLKRALIDTAMNMLQEKKGWQFTLREVARRAGVSHAAPYKHFPDKAALLTEIALVGFDRLKEALASAAIVQPAAIRDELFKMAQAYMDFAGANPALYRLMFSADTGKASELHLSDRALAPLGLLKDALERGQGAGQLRERDVRGQAAACWAQIHGLAMLGIDGLLLPEKVGPDPIENALATLIEGLEHNDARQFP